MADEMNMNIADALSAPDLPEPKMELGGGRQDTTSASNEFPQAVLGGYQGVNWQEVAPTTFAERIDAVYGTGNPAGTMAWSVVSDIDGNPVLVTEDDRGQLQSIKTTPSHAATVLTQQSRYATAMEEKAKAQVALAKKKNELKPQFSASLDEVDDPAYQALLRSRFEDNPTLAMDELIKHLQVKRRDEESAAIQVQRNLEEHAQQGLINLRNNFNQQTNTEFDMATQVYDKGIQNPNADPDALGAQFTHATRIRNLRNGAMQHSPTTGRQALLSPMSMGLPAAKKAFQDWMAAMSVGAITGTPYQIPHPRDGAYENEATQMEVLAMMNNYAASMGWQGSLTLDDVSAIKDAAMVHYQVHAEAIHVSNLESKISELEKQLAATTTSGVIPQAAISSLEQDIAGTRQQMALDTNNDGIVDSFEQGRGSSRTMDQFEAGVTEHAERSVGRARYDQASRDAETIDKGQQAVSDASDKMRDDRAAAQKALHDAQDAWAKYTSDVTAMNRDPEVVAMLKKRVDDAKAAYESIEGNLGNYLRKDILDWMRAGGYNQFLNDKNQLDTDLFEEYTDAETVEEALEIRYGSEYTDADPEEKEEMKEKESRDWEAAKVKLDQLTQFLQ